MDAYSEHLAAGDDVDSAPINASDPRRAQLRLNDASLVILQSVLDILGSDAAAGLRGGIAALHTASLRDRPAVTAQAAQIHDLLAPLEDELVGQSFSSQEKSALRRGLVQRAASGQYRHFTAAEQAFLAVETLNIVLDDATRLDAAMDAWFATVEDENDFAPLQYAEFARRLQAAL